jgi:threonine dehydratase
MAAAADGLTLARIRAARDRIDSYLAGTPVHVADEISRRLCLPERAARRPRVCVKPEYRQTTRAFKLRGALNFALIHQDEIRRHGAVTASAGNHAQGVAVAVARVLGLPEQLTIFVPVGTPDSKLDGIERYAGRPARVEGGRFEETKQIAQDHAATTGAIFIPPYDDYDVMAGQGTIGLEILEEYPEVDLVAVPVGGGGLVAGVATAVKETAELLEREIKVIGVEEVGRTCAHYARSRGRAEPLPPELVLDHPIADGIAVTQVGEKCFPLIERYVDSLYAVWPDNLIVGAACLQIDDPGDEVVEGAGAAAATALVEGHVDPRVACAVSREEEPFSALRFAAVAELETCMDVCVVASGGNARHDFSEDVARIEGMP